MGEPAICNPLERWISKPGHIFCLLLTYWIPKVISGRFETINGLFFFYSAHVMMVQAITSQVISFENMSVL